jgi:hypothetical protein
MTMKINEIWNEMESDNSSTGLLLRRSPSSVLPDVFIGFRKNEKLRCIAVKLNNNNNIDLSRYSNLKDIKPELVSDERDNSKAFLLVLLKNTQHQDVFAILCEDLINGIAGITQEDKVVKELLNRLEKWKSLFDKAAAEGLTPEEQRGLYGELYFLRKWITSSADYSKCIQSWVGTENAVRDFQFSDWALEVKTTHGNNHQKIQINSERQLDTANLNTLMLLHLSLEVQQRNGELLNTIVIELIEMLMTDIASQTQFKSKLLHAGYFNHHQPLYENLGYQIRQENFYLINNEFPRIEERDVRKGVGDVKYSIILSEYTDYIISEDSVLKLIN